MKETKIKVTGIEIDKLIRERGTAASNHYFILDEQNNTVSVNFDEWLAWDSDPNSKKKIVKKTYVDHLFVSTVFLGINHQFGPGEPLLFETMIFDTSQDDRDISMKRCSTYEEALKQHEEGCCWAMGKLLIDREKA